MVDGPQEFPISLQVDLMHFVCFISKLNELILNPTLIGRLCADTICEKDVGFIFFPSV